MDQDSLISQREARMAEGGTTYRSYLLRLWRDDSASAPWRASLESVAEGAERHHFPDLESMIAFLLAELETSQGLPTAYGHAVEGSKNTDK